MRVAITASVTRTYIHINMILIVTWYIITRAAGLGDAGFYVSMFLCWNPTQGVSTTRSQNLCSAFTGTTYPSILATTSA